MPRGLLLGREVFDAVEAAAQEPGALRKGTGLPQDRRQAELHKGAGGWDGLFSKVSVERQRSLVPVSSSLSIKSKSFQWGGGVAGKSQLTQGPAGWGCIDLSVGLERGWLMFCLH